MYGICTRLLLASGLILQCCPLNCAPKEGRHDERRALRDAAPSRRPPWGSWGSPGSRCLPAGCATPIGVKPVDIQTAYRLHTRSALGGTAVRALANSAQAARAPGSVRRRAGAVLAALHRGLRPAGDDDRLFALAELSFLHAERTGDRAYFLASAVRLGAPVPGRRHRWAAPALDPRVRLAYDLYNQGVAGAEDSRHEDGTSHGVPAATRAGGGEVRLEPGARPLPFGTLQVTMDASGLSWSGYRLDTSSRQRPSRSGASGTATAGPGSVRLWRRAWRQGRRQRTSLGRSALGPARRWR